jgi:hypothetical protein
MARQARLIRSINSPTTGRLGHQPITYGRGLRVGQPGRPVDEGAGPGFVQRAGQHGLAEQRQPAEDVHRESECPFGPGSGPYQRGPGFLGGELVRPGNPFYCGDRERFTQSGLQHRPVEPGLLPAHQPVLGQHHLDGVVTGHLLDIDVLENPCQYRAWRRHRQFLRHWNRGTGRAVRTGVLGRARTRRVRRGSRGRHDQHPFGVDPHDKNSG